MASLKELKVRISSVKSTRKITKAMQMVAAAKLRRAQEAAENARPYGERIERVLSNLAVSLQGDPNAPRLLVGTGQDKTHLLVVATADRGLCGAFNSSIARLARDHAERLRGEGKTVKILCVGRKGRDFLKRTHGSLIEDTIEFTGVRQIAFEHASGIAQRIMAAFDRGEFDVCTIFYARFESVVSQVPTAQRLIPAQIAEDASAEGTDAQDLGGALYDYEPDEASIVAGLLPLNLSAQVFRALLENAASEQGAKMSAMDNATRNASDLIDSLTLEYNRSRQAAITKELIEIISGAEAI
ncbi:MAG: F0F1 ATP synthase subunit gamma [Alphaproteobacteria bacterium]